MRSRNPDHRDVDPLPGLVPWVGGKRELAKTLAGLIDATPHLTYVEPFLGMGGVFFRRRRAPKAEVINDLNGEVANLFRVVRRHPSALLEELRFTLRSRVEFRRLLAVDPATLTDVERAARFYYVQRANYGGIPGNRSFPASPYRSHFLPPEVVMGRIRAAHGRLALVTIESLPYAELIARYDRPDTLYYLDPPYWGDERLYGKGLFERADFERLAGQLRGIRGRFILSLNDRPEVRRLFRGFRLRPVQVTYRLAQAKKFPELIITGPARKRA